MRTEDTTANPAEEPKRATLRDVAEAAGVSVATASNALRGKGRVSEAQKQRILAIAGRLNYRPDVAAQSLVLRRTSVIGKEPGSGGRKARRGVPGRGRLQFGDIDTLAAFVAAELAQRREEGCDVAEAEARLSRAMAGRPAKNELEAIYASLLRLEVSPDFPYREPSDLAEIRAERPAGPRTIDLWLSTDELMDRVYGAWLGRCVGCLLGKPLETGWPREKIRRYLEMANSYPLRSYVPDVIPRPDGFELHPDAPTALLGHINGMPPDDDIAYTLIALHVLERHGLGFSTENIASEWLNHLPYFTTWTAERAAYRNLAQGIQPPHTATYQNPYRELIGAQIRGDMWGYVCPGRPELAAELAFRDARLSHVKNGIYGEMWVATMLAATFASRDVREIIQIGLSEIPQRCRLAEAVIRVMEWCDRTDDWETVADRIWKTYGHYNGVHVINNAAVVTLALLQSGGDFERGITIAVMSGLDTDCNGATVGSILGLLVGARALPEKWLAPLDDRFESWVAGLSHGRISDLARRTTAISRQVLEGTC
ncbi:MAG: ADP-ribosylglycohydrolase family protein [Anaerolineae bacterium]|nr:ADP-ribosylglycohydrolase family protein [Anaerolineae bacterium]